MSDSKKALVLIGSPRGSKATSAVLAERLSDRMAARGWTVESRWIHRAVSGKSRLADLVADTDTADCLVLACPLYVDSLPAPVIRVMETVAEHRRARPPAPAAAFGAIINSGFPEPHQNDTALSICRLFAQAAGFSWAGGLALGGGEVIGGRPLSRVGFPARHAARALDLAGDALAAGRPIPDRAVRLMARPMVPYPLFLWFGSIYWFREARKHGQVANLNDRPYAHGS